MITSFVKNGRLMSLFIALLIVAGLGALSNLPRTEDPRIVNRMASIVTPFPGASAERVEVLVSEIIEQKMRRLPEIDLITSTSRAGMSIVQLKLLDEITNAKPIWSRVRDLLNDVEPELPKGALTPSLEDDRGYAYTQLISLSWQQNTEVNVASLGRYANDLQNRLKMVSGTDLVTIFGDGEEEVTVAIDHHKLAAAGLNIAQVSDLVGQADAKVSAGQLVNDQHQMQLEITGAIDTLERLRSIPLQSANSHTTLNLGDIAQISKQLKHPASEIAIINDKPSVVVATRMLPNLRIDKWTADVNAIVSEYQAQLPQHITLEVLFDQNRYTENRLSDLVQNIALGFVIIALVLFVSLGWRSALIVTLSLPMTVLFTLSVMYFYGLPIHQMSVTGLVVALGIMVDNAIVMTDTIKENRERGMRRLASVQAAVNHLWLPLLGSTVTTVLAFMPIVLMPGPAGEFVGGIALSVIFSLIGSYIISHTLVAGLAGRFLPKKQKDLTAWYQRGVRVSILSRNFEKSLRWSLAHKKRVIAAVCLLPLLGFNLASQLSEQFFPASDRDMFQIELFMPNQVSIYRTEKVSQDISSYLHSLEGIEQVQWFIGKNAPSFYYNLMPTKDGAQYYGQAMVTTTDFHHANRLIPQIQSALDDNFPHAQILVRKLEQGPPFNAPVEIRLFGPNLDTLKQLGNEMRSLMSTVPNMVHTRSTLQPGPAKVWLEIDEQAAKLSGLTLVNIAQQLNSHLDGVVNGSLIEATESIPVRVRIGNSDRTSLASLSSISLLSPAGNKPIPLTAVAKIHVEPTLGQIPHREGKRVNIIEGYIRAGVLPSTVLEEIKDKLMQENYTLPHGYYYEFGGESAERNDAVGKLMASVGLIVTLLIAVVVLSFNSFRLSAIIFLSAFQSVGLGLLSIYIFDYPFGFTVIIGLIGLMGLAINAAIVIIAELKSDQAAVAGDIQAIVSGVKRCGRHICSTTVTTVGGFLPLIVAGGGFWPPFAVAIAGGTVLTTLLSFYFVPAIFVWFSQRQAFECNEPQEISTH